MNLVDLIVFLFLILFGVVGAKRGVFKELVLLVGTVLVFYLAYIFKDFLGNIFLLNLPMFDFPSFFKGVITLNILLYQTLAFLIVLAILLIVLNVLLSITVLFEKILKFTIVLGIPSKILGFFAGLAEGYVILFVILFFLTQPAFSFNKIRDSKYATKVLTSSPLLTDITKDSVDLMENIYALKNEKNTDVLNTKILDMSLDKKIIDYKTANDLYKNGKIKFNGMGDVLDKYK